MRSVPIEDPLEAIDRIQEYVRTHTYAEAYEYLRSPPDAEAPHRKNPESGTGYFLGAVLLAPIWVLAAPLALTGLAKSVAPPSPDERRNQPLRRDLLEKLASLRQRAEAELAADAANARKLTAHFETLGVDGLGEVRTHMVTKDWASIYITRAGIAKKRRNGWHVTEMGQLHIGSTNAGFFGNEGDVLELDLRGIASTTVIKRGIVLMNPRRRNGMQLAVFVPTKVFETAAHLNALRSRVAVQPTPGLRPAAARSAATLASKGVQAIRTLRRKKEG